MQICGAVVSVVVKLPTTVVVKLPTVDLSVATRIYVGSLPKLLLIQAVVPIAEVHSVELAMGYVKAY